MTLKSCQIAGMCMVGVFVPGRPATLPEAGRDVGFTRLGTGGRWVAAKDQSRG